MAACENVINASSVAMFAGGTLIAYSNDVSFTITHELRETTSKDSAGWAEHMEGKRTWEAAIAGWYANDAFDPVSYFLENSILTRAKVDIEIKVHPNTPQDVIDNNGAMNKTITGSAWVENINVNANGNGTNADFTASLRGCNPLTYA